MHHFAVASQKFTCPTVTGAPPAVTVAVNVTAVRDATVVTALPPMVTASEVVVGTMPAQAGPTPKRQVKHTASARSIERREKGNKVITGNLDSWGGQQTVLHLGPGRG
jgi:hypothetical protein